MSKLSISNWPFSVKFIAPASLAVAVMLSVGAYGVHSLDNQARKTSEVVNQSNLTTKKIVSIDFAGSALLLKIAGDVKELNGQFYEILTRESAKLNKDGAADLLKLREKAKSIVKELEEYNQNYATPDQVQKISDIVSQIKQNFIGNNDDGIFDVSSQIIGIDISLIFQGIQNYQNTYNNVLKTIQNLTDENIKNSLENADTSAAASLKQSAEMMTGAESAKKNFITILIGMTTLIALFGYMVSRSTVSSIRKIATATDSLANGDTNVEIDQLARRDELRSIVSALQIFKDNTIRIRKLEVEQKEAEVKSTEDRKRAMNNLAQNFDDRTSGIINSLANSAKEMQNTAELVDETSRKTSRSSEIVALSVAEADSSVKTASHASGELSLSSREIAQQITYVAQKSNQTATSAEDTSQKVAELNRLADSIGEIVESIRAIAEQTNLLALNATIEAARAGDAGKGFAVVADEVKKLASETTNQTERINERVGQIQSAVKDTVVSVGKIILDIKTIDNATTAVASAVEEQNAATTEIGRNVEQISEETTRVTTAIHEVIDSAKVSTEAASSVLLASKELNKISEMLEMEVASFLSEIRQK